MQYNSSIDAYFPDQNSGSSSSNYFPSSTCQWEQGTQQLGPHTPVAVSNVPQDPFVPNSNYTRVPLEEIPVQTPTTPRCLNHTLQQTVCSPGPTTQTHSSLGLTPVPRPHQPSSFPFELKMMPTNPFSLSPVYTGSQPIEPFRVYLVRANTNQIVPTTNELVTMNVYKDGVLCNQMVKSSQKDPDFSQQPLLFWMLNGIATISNFSFCEVSHQKQVKLEFALFNSSMANTPFRMAQQENELTANSASGGHLVPSLFSEEFLVRTHRIRSRDEKRRDTRLRGLTLDTKLEAIPGIGKEYTSRFSEMECHTMRDLCDYSDPTAFICLAKRVCIARGRLTQNKLREHISRAIALLQLEIAENAESHSGYPESIPDPASADQEQSPPSPLSPAEFLNDD